MTELENMSRAEINELIEARNITNKEENKVRSLSLEELEKE